MEIEQTTLAFSMSLLKWLGITSFGGILSLYVAWVSFRPEIVIDTVIDKSKKFSSESRIKIRNNGRIPAHDIRVEAEYSSVKFGGITIKDCGVYDGPKTKLRLSHSESFEISITPGISDENATQIEEFSYRLTIEHKAKLFFLKKEYRKAWAVNLRNFEDGFAWHVSPA